jgi:N-dimethylarginine dimethylaminohydrolase
MKVGYNSEYGRLKSVFLHIPRRGELEMVSPEEAMYEYQPNYDIVLDEVDGYIKLLKSLGVEVHTSANTPDYLYYPNGIYMRDVAAMMHDAIIIGNPRYDVRKGEELNFIKYLRSIDYNGKLIEMNDDITFEGADMLRKSPTEIIISAGNRTSIKVVDTLKALYPEITFTVVEARPEGIPQHVLGVHMIVDADTLILRTDLSQNRLGYTNVIELKETDEVKKKYATNVLVIGPKELIMPDDCPETQKIYESYGIKCHLSKMSEIRKMSGGFACGTLILNREFI